MRDSETTGCGPAPHSAKTWTLVPGVDCPPACTTAPHEPGLSDPLPRGDPLASLG